MILNFSPSCTKINKFNNIYTLPWLLDQHLQHTAKLTLYIAKICKKYVQKYYFYRQKNKLHVHYRKLSALVKFFHKILQNVK